jgi:hypothetical protein
MHKDARLSLLVALGLASCANGGTYVPSVTSNAVVAKMEAADYPIPPEKPTGDVRLATLGVIDVHPMEAPTGTAKAIHLRMVATNTGSSPWTIDAREQRIAVAGGAQIRAGEAFTVQGAQPPVVKVAPGGKETIDLFFLLPTALRQASTRPEFDVLWTVHTATRIVEERTSFDRLSNSTYYGDDWNSVGGWGGSSSPSR